MEFPAYNVHQSLRGGFDTRKKILLRADNPVNDSPAIRLRTDKENLTVIPEFISLASLKSYS